MTKIFKILLVVILVVDTACQPANALDSEVKESVAYANALSSAFENAAKVITPSVVTISSTKKFRKPAKVQRPKPGTPNDPLLEFFGEHFFERFIPHDGNSAPQQGLGTGFILDEEGHVLTNNHVIEGADEITVKLPDDRTLKASIVGTDPKTDLAVLKIQADNLVPVKLGDSSSLKTGEWVVAAGNPFGLDNTITAGIVSAKGRAITNGFQYEDFIQTDAAINPGNSGGPLVNLKGEVVGINSAIFTRSGGYMGIGFAIPINMAQNVFNSLITDGKVVRGWLGVAIQNLSDDLARSFNYPQKNGALVGDVSEDSPAAKAGIEPGDIIVEYDGKKIKDVNHLRNMVAETKPDQNVSLRVFRDGREVKIKVEIAELDQEEINQNTPGGDVDEEIGMRVETLTPEIQKNLGIKTDYGVVVTEVLPYGAAAEAGLQVRDLILKVNSQKVKNVIEFNKILKDADLKEGVRLIVENAGMKRFVLLKEN